MSLSKIIFPALCWGEFIQILAFLPTEELYRTIGHLNRSGWLTFMREKLMRKSKLYQYSILERRCPRFLPKLEQNEKVLLVSYPRSGNSFLRQLLELHTNIITGSDSRPNRILSASLLSCGYLGEGITDNSVLIVKSHFPERLGFIKFRVKKIILLVRNPFDAILSYFHMGMTNTHDKNLTDEAFESVRSEFERFLVNEASIWNKFHSFWIRMSKEYGIPIHFIRYEDIITDGEESIRSLLEFLGKKYGKNYNNYIDSSPRYRKSSLSGGYGKAISYFLPENIQKINSICDMKVFGYSIDYSFDKFNLRLSALEYSKEMKTCMQNNKNSEEKSTFLVNDNFEIRDKDDIFGRKFTDLRKKYTDNDMKPFNLK